MAFVQAQIPVENAELFSRLKDTIAQALSPGNVEKYLKAVTGSGTPVRDFEKLLLKSVLDKTVAVQGGAYTLYQNLPVSDQGQIREFYLTKIEEVAAELRRKYSKVYRYS